MRHVYEKQVFVIEHRLKADIIVAELVQVLAHALLNSSHFEVLLLKCLRQLHLASKFVFFDDLANFLQVLIHLCLSNLPVLLLSIGQMSHNLSQLHFAQLVQFFGFEHAGLDLTDGLWEDLNVLIG